MTEVQVLEEHRDAAGGYRVDASRGDRIGRVSSEWFSRPADERYLSLSEASAPSPLAGINLQHGLLAHRAEQVKTLEVEDGRVELRAVTGPEYGRLYDHELVDAVRCIAGNGTGDTRWKVPACSTGKPRALNGPHRLPATAGGASGPALTVFLLNL